MRAINEILSVEDGDNIGFLGSLGSGSGLLNVTLDVVEAVKAVILGKGRSFNGGNDTKCLQILDSVNNSGVDGVTGDSMAKGNTTNLEMSVSVDKPANLVNSESRANSKIVPVDNGATIEQVRDFLRHTPACSRESPFVTKPGDNAILHEVGSNAIKLEDSTEAPTTPRQERIRDFSKLNRSDQGELMRHRSLMTSIQTRHLQSVRDKVEYYPNRYRSCEYLPQSGILLLSHAWASAERYALCSIPNKGNPGGFCRLHRFCPYCCWYERQKFQLTYVPAFHNGTWHFLTGSFRGELTMAFNSDAFTWVDYWDAYKLALENWVRTGVVRGVFWCEELAVNSFLPAKVLPHVHALVDADEITAGQVQELLEAVSAYLQKTVEDEPLQPNVRIAAVESDRSLLDHVGYMVKPLNTVKAYEQAWPAASFHNRHLAQQLNSQATDVVVGYSHVTTRRKKVNAKGSLDWRTKGFIGITKAEHRFYRDEVAALQAEARDEYIEVHNDDQELAA